MGCVGADGCMWSSSPTMVMWYVWNFRERWLEIYFEGWMKGWYPNLAEVYFWCVAIGGGRKTTIDIHRPWSSRYEWVWATTPCGGSCCSKVFGPKMVRFVHTAATTTIELLLQQLRTLLLLLLSLLHTSTTAAPATSPTATPTPTTPTTTTTAVLLIVIYR